MLVRMSQFLQDFCLTCIRMEMDHPVAGLVEGRSPIDRLGRVFHHAQSRTSHSFVSGIHVSATAPKFPSSNELSSAAAAAEQGIIRRLYKRGTTLASRRHLAQQRRQVSISCGARYLSEDGREVGSRPPSQGRLLG